MKYFLVFLLSLLSNLNFASAVIPTFKVIKIYGKVYSQKDNEKAKILNINDRLASGATIETEPRSYVVLSDPKGGNIRLSPKSILRLDDLNRDSLHSVTQLSGRLRYTYDKHESKQSKLIIKTKIAAIGVRGTDLTVTYNPNNNITSTIVHEGKVQLTKKEENEENNKIEEDLNSSFSNEVMEGHFSGVYPGFDFPSNQTKIAITQADVLREQKDDDLVLTKSKQNILASDESYIDFSNSIEEDYDNENILNLNQVLVPAPKHLSTSEYYQDVNRAPIMPRAGGYLDLNTGIYISPPENAKFDQKNKTFVQEKYYGGIDASTGDYVPPNGLELSETEGFIASIDQKVLTKDQQTILNLLNKKVKKDFIDVIKNKFNEHSSLQRLQFFTYFNLLYDSNITFDLHREVMDVTNESSGIITSGLTLGHRFIDSKKWKVIPKGQAEIIHYTNSTSTRVDKHDRSFLAAGIDIERHYRQGELPAKHYINVEVRSMYKDFRDHNRYSFFNRDAQVKVGEKFNVFTNFIADFSFSYFSYQTHESNNRGEIYLAELASKYVIDKYHSLKLYYYYQRKLLDINDQEINIWQFGLELFRSSILKNTDVITEIYYKQTNPTFREEDKGKGTKVTLHKDLKNLLFAQAFYEYFDQDSILSDFKYKKHVFGLGISSVY